MKILRLIINARIEQKLNTQLNETQYGFVTKRDTRDAIVLLKMMVQRALNIGRDVIACFIDSKRPRGDSTYRIHTNTIKI